MSFLSELVNKKFSLKKTTTTIKQADGKLYTEDSNMRQLGLGPIDMMTPQNYGFVVDTAPDNIPAEVLPNVYIGSQDCVEEQILQKYNITYLLSIGVELNANINKLYVPCLDLPETDINPVLSKTNEYMRRALNNDKTILVHCNAGVSRAAMVVIGFLIVEKNMPFDDAYRLVKTVRPCIQPNIGFIRQLKLLK